MIRKLARVGPARQALPLTIGRHVPALDGLRGLAILMVMVTHYAHGGHHSLALRPFFAAANAGWTGVDLFFVLSGFLITGILLDAKGTSGYFVNFYVRRILRVFPLYYAVLVATFVAIPLLSGRGAAEGVAGSGWLWWYGANVYPVVHGATLDVPNVPGWSFGHLWSLAVEEHFYMAWPLVVWACSRRALMGTCLAVGVGSLVARCAWLGHGGGMDVAYQFTGCRLEGLVAGAFCAAAARGDGGLVAWSKVARAAVVGAGAALAGIAWRRGGLAADDKVVATVGYTLLAAFYAGGLVLVVLGTSRVGRRFFEARWLRFFGKYSYGLYVLHHLWLRQAYAWTTPLADRSYVVSVVVRLLLGVAVSTLLAVATFHLLERPFLRLKDRFQYGRKSAGIKVAPASGRDVPLLVAS